MSQHVADLIAAIDRKDANGIRAAFQVREGASWVVRQAHVLTSGPGGIDTGVGR